MDSLNAKQIDEINDLLLQQGVSFNSLRDDLLDHICCMVEEGLSQGKDFSSSLEEALNNFGMGHLKLIQESTLYLLNNKLNNMKKTAAIIGMIASTLVITGIISRVNHIAGAGIMLVLGLASASILVFPLLGYMSVVAREDKQTIATNLVGYGSGMLIALGSLFKLMHWPGAMIIFWLGAIILLLAFMPLYTIRSYRLAENKLFALSKSMLILTGMVLIWGLSVNTRIFKVDFTMAGQELVQTEK
ncbi:MAG: hypothetical protein CL840_20035 [Crocinitomicaceae bacterium]|nr:hypothetical protein [Crocinitomicaceae bacterium]|tara:strand:+ start:9429 stop:10163 length:735 start_codon:yes stop_codon:yes gene_type:complete